MTVQDIPAEMRALKRWVCYRLEQDPAKPSKKPSKVPYQIGGTHASSTNPDTWSTFAQACAAVAAKKFDGISYALVSGDGLVCVDLDHARNPETGLPEPWAHPIIDALASYTEVSPSGTGYHIFLKGAIPKASHKQDSRVELYAGAKIMATTGEVGFDGYDTIESRPEALADLFKRAEAGEFSPQRSTKEPAIANGGDESAEDWKLIAQCRLKRNNTWDAKEIESAIKAEYPERYALRNRAKGSRNGKDYFLYTIENFIKKELARAEVEPVVEREERTIEEEPLPDFPRFAGSLSELSAALCPDLPFCHKFMSALTLVGGILSGRVHLADSQHLDPRFYSVLIDVGGAGKGGAWLQVRDALAGLLGELHIKNSVDSGPALVQELALTPRLLLFSDELSALFEKAKVTGSSKNSLFSELLSLHDGHETENTAKGNLNLPSEIRDEICKGTSIRVTNAHFCMLGCVQPLVFQSMWGGTKGGASGLQSRYVLASSGQLNVPEPQAPSDAEKVEAAVGRIRQQIEKYTRSEDCEPLQGFGGRPLIYRSKEIGQRQRDWWKERMALPGASSRLPALISRFAMILAITNDSEEITPELFEQALAFGEYQIEMCARFMPSDSLSFVQAFEQKIIRMFEKHSAGGLTFTECRRYVNPEKQTLLGGYGPFWTAWNNLLRVKRLVMVAKTQRSEVYELQR